MTRRSLDAISEQALAAAKSAGADAADVLVLEGTSLSIDVREGALEQAERAEGVDIGVRVFLGQKVAIASASDLSDATIEELAQRAVAMAEVAPEDPYVGLAEPDQLAKAWYVAALELSDPADEPSPDHLKALAQEAEAAALAVDGVSQTQGASAAYGERRTHLAATNGFSGGYARTDAMVSCVAIAGEGLGMERDYDGDHRIFAADLRDATDIGRQAGERAVAHHGARKPPTGSYPVLYDERISSSLIGHLVSAASGASIARGMSWLRDRLGEEVLPKGMSLVEDPHRPRVLGSRPFDAEGLATAPRTLVEDGVLQGWTLDLANARKLGMESTASAARGAGSGPSPSATNLALTPGTQTREDLIRDMGTGLLITSMIGSTINPNTGDYSRGASGFWIENGEITYPVNECTVAGNLHDMLRGMTAANDARAHLSRVVPSLLVEGLTLAGA